MTTIQDRLTESLPPGLERALLRILDFHRGRERAIPRPELLAGLQRVGFHPSDRQMRAVINQLRKDGHVICSAGGEDGGYWLAANWDELNEYIEHEVHPRAMDFLEQEKALKAAASRLWGPESNQIAMGI